MKKSNFLVFFLIFVSLKSLYSQILDDEPKLIVRDSLSKDKYYVRTYFDKKGKNIQSEGLEINGLKDSVWTNYFKNGEVRIKTVCEEGFVVDILVQYNKKNISLPSVYKNNNYTYLTFYNPKGEVDLEIIDSYNSKYSKYFTKGKLSKTIESDTLNRVETIYLKKGYVFRKIEYKTKSSSGNYYLYTIVRELWFYEGELLFIYYYDENGKKIKEEYFLEDKLIESIQIEN